MEEVKYQHIEGLPYHAVWDMQQNLHKELIANKIAQKQTDETAAVTQVHHLLLCEHSPVFTLGRSGDQANLLLNTEQLAARGIEYFPINRGGDITYHGPGQITGYPLLDLDCFFTDVHKYVRCLEEVVIRVLETYGILGIRLEGYTGVWVSDTRGNRKLCAIGVHLSRWVTLHGFALNVNTNLSYFDFIVPCGIIDPDKSVSSIALELGHEVPMAEVEARYLIHFAEVFGCNVV